MATNEQVYRFIDGDAYERYMGRWSRAACPEFLAWLGAPKGRSWLDVGCGTGALTAAILASEAPASIDAVDPAPAQVETARAQLASPLARFGVADACALPFDDAHFDIVASALVVNFIPDRPKALAEMHRVTRPGGLVAGFVWDFAAERSPSGPVRRALAEAGAVVPSIPGVIDSPLDRFARLFADAGFTDIEMRVIDVVQRFPSAEEFWTAQTTGFAPPAGIVKKTAPEIVARAKALAIASVQAAGDGSVSYASRANAVKARKR